MFASFLQSTVCLFFKITEKFLQPRKHFVGTERSESKNEILLSGRTGLWRKNPSKL